MGWDKLIVVSVLVALASRGIDERLILTTGGILITCFCGCNFWAFEDFGGTGELTPDLMGFTKGVDNTYRISFA